MYILYSWQWTHCEYEQVHLCDLPSIVWKWECHKTSRSITIVAQRAPVGGAQLSLSNRGHFRYFHITHKKKEQ